MTTPTPTTTELDRGRAIRRSATPAVVALLAVPFLVALTQVVFDGPLTRIDEEVAEAVNSHHLRDPGTAPVIRAITHLGSVPLLVGLVAITAVALWTRGPARRRQAIYLVATTSGAAVINSLLKVVVDRNRPQFEEVIATAVGKSFPSGHALNSTTVYGSLLLIAWPHLRTVAARVKAATATASLVLAIAASRVMLVVHYLTDVIAGLALGALLLVGSLAIFRTWLIAETPTSGQSRMQHGVVPDR